MRMFPVAAELDEPDPSVEGVLTTGRVVGAAVFAVALADESGVVAFSELLPLELHPAARSSGRASKIAYRRMGLFLRLSAAKGSGAVAVEDAGRSRITRSSARWV